MEQLTSGHLGRLLGVVLLVGLLLPGIAVAQQPDEGPDSDRLNPELQAGVRADDIPDVPQRDATAPASSEFAQPVAAFAGEGCPLSLYPEDPADAAAALGITPYHELAPRLCEAAGASARISLEVGGTSVEGREVPVVTITRSWSEELRAANDALRDLLVEDPEAAADLRAEGGYDGYRPTIMAISNIHGDEYEGLDASLDFVEYLVDAEPDAPIVQNTEGLSEEEISALPTVTEVLSDYVITLMPTTNPDGRVTGQRRNANGFDLNRDHITGSQPETRIIREVITEQQPMLFLDIHGYVGPGGLIEPTTPPHNFAYEYDLYIQGALPTALSMESEAFRRQIIPDVTGETSTNIPYRDLEQSWDDWPPIFTAMYAIFHGGSGHTVEMPSQPALDVIGPAERELRVTSNTEFARAAIDGTIIEGVSSRDALLERQLEWHLRGVAGASQNNEALVGEFEGYDELDVWTTDYPDAYIIPVGEAQESDAAAAVLVDALLSQRVEVTQLVEPTEIRGTEYPAGTYVVNMRQAKRAVAQTMLDVGQDITPRGIEFMYDISGWSHADLWGATVFRTGTEPGGLDPVGTPVTETPALGQVLPGPADAYAFELVDEAAIRTLNRLLEAEVTIHRAPDGRMLVAPSARPLMQEIAVDEDVTFVPLEGLPDGRRQVLPTTVGTTSTGPDAYVLSEILGFPTIPLDAAAINDGDALDDADALLLDVFPEGMTTAGTDNINDFLDDGGGAVASNGGVGLLDQSDITVPSRVFVAGLSNGTVLVEQRDDSPVMPDRPEQDVTFAYPPTVFTDVPDGWNTEQTVLPGSAGGVFRAGHWAQNEEGTLDQADYVGEPLTLSGELDIGGRVVVTGADVTFRDHTKGLYKDLADWIIWTTIGEETTADLGGPLPDIVERVSGDNRVETAVELSRRAYPDSSEVAVIAAAGTFPDALSAGPYAASLDAPVLLTDTADVPDVLVDELQRLDPSQIVVIGGTVAVSEDAASLLDEIAPVTRIAGPDRYSTSALVSQAFAEPGVRVVLATGEAFPDALAGGVLAGAGDGPVLLTRPGDLPQSTAEELARLEPAEVLVMGGPAAVADETVAAVDTASDTTARRIAGGNRFETAVAAARELGPVGSVYLATGSAFADALAAVPVALQANGAILLVQPDAVPEPVMALLDELEPFETLILGGTAAVSADVEASLTPD
ncbi:cell wall-binding repeat-containing protein [Euzebya tangerina]|uniref:cell wall-binding repeat-containing protein n=1 Tax=Euzebya tangerina TaxID=591198 RepID=UPI000E31F0AF|nr:cell wall-binding repeat-containing protein [Euzebya tangerina]